MKSIASQIDDKLAGAAAARRRAKNTRSDPRDASEAEEKAVRLEAEAADLVAAREDNLTLARSIRSSLDNFSRTAHRSAERSTAIRKLREAAMWLEEEAGTAPQQTIPCPRKKR